MLIELKYWIWRCDKCDKPWCINYHHSDCAWHQCSSPDSRLPDRRVQDRTHDMVSQWENTSFYLSVETDKHFLVQSNHFTYFQRYYWDNRKECYNGLWSVKLGWLFVSPNPRFTVSCFFLRNFLFLLSPGHFIRVAARSYGMLQTDPILICFCFFLCWERDGKLLLRNVRRLWDVRFWVLN